jgi:hypothetical protein
MSKTSADLVKEWRAERTELRLKIADLTGGGPLPAGESEMITKVATLDSLIADFSRCDTFPLTFFHGDQASSSSNPDLAPPVQVRKTARRAGSVIVGSRSA